MLVWSGLWMMGSASAAPVLGSQRYAVVMCRYAGDPWEPATVVEIEDLLGTSAGPGAAGTVNHALSQFSFGQVDLFGTEVFGWFELPDTQDGYNTGISAHEMVEDCVSEVIAAEGIDPIDYAGFVVLHNDFIPWNVSHAPAYAYTWPVPLTFDDGTSGLWRIAEFSEVVLFRRHTYVHELGHTFGFKHTAPIGGSEYGSPWDMMSSGSCQIGADGCVDVHPIAYHKSEAGWIPTDRETTLAPPTPWTGSTHDIRLHHLAALPPALSTDQLLVRVDLGIPDLTFEARVARSDNYDGLLPGSGVIVHHVEQPGSFDPQPRLYGGLDGPYQADVEGSRFGVGEVFSDNFASGKVTMTVLGSNKDSANRIDSFDIRVELGPHDDPLVSCAAQTQIDEGACDALLELSDLALSVAPGFGDSAFPCWWTGVACQDVDGDGDLEVTKLWVNANAATSGWDLTFTAAADGLFDGLPHLGDLKLNDDVSGPLPSSVFGLLDLEYLNLSHTNLQGSLPEALGDLTRLRNLHLNYVPLTGPVPASIGGLYELRQLATSGSGLTGDLPIGILDTNPDSVSLASGLCVPFSSDFDSWLGGLLTVNPDPPPRCGVYVDGSASTGGDGTAGRPFQTISAGVQAATPGHTVQVAPGSYQEAVDLWKPVSVVGMGDLEVEVPYAGAWLADAAGAEIHNIRFIGRSGSTAIRASRPFTVEGCQFEDHGTGILNSRVSSNTSIVRNRFLNTNYGVMSFDSGWSNYVHVENNVFVDGVIASYSYESRTRVDHNLISGFRTGIAHVLQPNRNLPISYVRNNLIVDTYTGVEGVNLDPHELKLFANAIDANTATKNVVPADEWWTYATDCHAPGSSWLPYEDDFEPDANCIDHGVGLSDPDGSTADIGPYGGPSGGPWWVDFPCVGPHCT